MRNIITQKDLENVVNRLNRITGNPEIPNYSTVGAYDLNYAYGGVALHKYTSEHGAVKDIFGYHMPKRELYNHMQAYIEGIGVGINQ